MLSVVQGLNVKPHKSPPSWLTWAVAAASALAVLDWPYGYYQLLRLVVTGYTAYVSYNYFTERKPQIGWIFVFPAVLFNPIFVIAMSKEIHALFNIAAAGLILFEFYVYRKPDTFDAVVRNDKLEGFSTGPTPVRQAKATSPRTVDADQSFIGPSKSFRLSKLAWVIGIVGSILAGVYVANADRHLAETSVEQTNNLDAESLHSEDYIPPYPAEQIPSAGQLPVDELAVSQPMNDTASSAASEGSMNEEPAADTYSYPSDYRPDTAIPSQSVETNAEGEQNSLPPN